MGKNYKEDAMYYLTLASSISVDLLSHSELVMNEIDQKRAEIRDEINAIGGVFSLSKILIKGKIKYSYKKKKLKNEINKELQLILDILSNADKLDPNLKMEVKDDEGRCELVSSNTIRASAFYSAARCYIAADKLKHALEAFSKSYNYMHSQEPLIGYAYAMKLQGGRGNTAKIVEAFEKVVEFDPYSEIGIEAAKEIARMQQK
ncbi:MAG: hypothetical protein HOG49_07860 [Candidatus Scalindua sp.]|jgi:tetratricopeptide (TPR) repeat protein|nr:hypothetical protein [Candidatus Scalindua sp.]